MELIKIYQGNLINARDLHEFLGSKKDFSSWIKARINRYQFVENEDYTIAHPNGGASWGGSNKVDYILTINMAKELAMVENTDKGREARRYFIEAEKTLNQLRENKRLETFFKLEATKKRLLKNVENIGGSHQDYVQIDFAGRMVLFNGDPMPDEKLPLALLKGRDFATELTNEFIKDGERTLIDAEDLNKQHHQKVRGMVVKSMKKTPEELNPEDDIKKLE
ncbi:MAG: antA/AntB antirepressor family protein [Flammeovirgaceae bacterium]|nr:antA/AntB antirepressor family protein [Flammeovirgaceae bacterium]